MFPRAQEDFKPTEAMIQAAETVFKCIAAVETIRPVVHGYQRAILQRYEFRSADGKQIILDPKHDHRMDDGDFLIYMEECRKEQAKSGLKTDDPDHCPLLVAEELLRKAQNVLIDTMEPITGVKHEQLFANFPEIYNSYLELTLRLLAPYVKSKLYSEA